MTAPQGGEGQRWLLSLVALGVVFGDIGTSPIYALRESLVGHGFVPSETATLGVLSLIFWALILVISVKYLGLVMRADNQGEGGIMALTALALPRTPTAGGPGRVLVLAGLFGAALLYGDSVLTPAISVLSAVEGAALAAPALSPMVVPATVTILIGLFAFQPRGTSGVGVVFGPVMLLWFATLGALGVLHIARAPEVLTAISPVHAVEFFRVHGGLAFATLGSVFLVVTGGEALYADMGHFGFKPIRRTWTYFVLPALLLNYFGQGALILLDPGAAEQPFFAMVPAWGLLPLVGLATLATVIASQAVISAAYSLTHQAVQLGYLPRLAVRHTSQRYFGQIYMPAVNWTLMVACVAVVLGFRSSGALANAYGVAVTTIMVFTTILFSVVAATHLRWRAWQVVLVTAVLLIVDLSFWAAVLPKVPTGGWFPLAVALLIYLLMTTWKRGRALLVRAMARPALTLSEFADSIREHPPTRVAGTAVFMTAEADHVPRTLLHNLKHNQVLHERVIIFTVSNVDVPRVDEAERASVETIEERFHQVVARFGFTEQPNVPRVLSSLSLPGYVYQEATTSFFVGETVVTVSERPGMARWRMALFERMLRNALRAPLYFAIPPGRVVGLGVQVAL